MNIGFQRDTAAKLLNKRISKSLNKTFYSAKLCIVPSSRSTTHEFSIYATSICIYKFSRYRGACYTSHKLVTSKRILEYYPARLLGRVQNNQFSIWASDQLMASRFAGIFPQHNTHSEKLSQSQIKNTLETYTLISELYMQTRDIQPLILYLR